MTAEQPHRHRVRFGLFELDLRTGDLRKAGARVRLAGQPLQILERLVERPGDLVTRDELRRELWSDDTFVDFERNLNSAIKRLRAALGDSADVPRFIETLPRRGYRFLVPVEIMTDSPVAAASMVSAAGDSAAQALRSAQPEVAVAAPDAPRARAPSAVPDAPRRPRAWAVTLVVFLVLIVAGGLLYRFIGTTGAREYEAIAVLPFVLADAASEEDEYLAFGMSEALITELSRLGGIRVISQTSSMQYKGAAKGLRQIAEELGVDAVIEGSVLREGHQVRITVQLIEAASDSHLWADTYEREIGSVLPLVSEVAQAVAREVHVQVAPEAARLTARRALDPRVTEAYLKGTYHLSQATEADLLRARQYFDEALAADPTYAPSHSGLADYYILTDSLPPLEAFAEARSHALRALELDEALPDAHASLAFVRYYGEWDWAGAEREFRRAIELDPGHSRARRWYGLFLAAMARHQEAREQVERALAVDPIAMSNHDAAAAIRFNARQFDESLAVARNMIDLDAFDPRGYEHLMLGLVQTGQYETALEAVEKGLKVSGQNDVLQCLRAVSLGRVGRTAEAERVLDALEREAGRRYVPAAILSLANADLGRHDRALALLEGAYERRDPYLVLIHVSPWFDPLRESPRFERIHQALAFPG